MTVEEIFGVIVDAIAERPRIWRLLHFVQPSYGTGILTNGFNSPPSLARARPSSQW